MATYLLPASSCPTLPTPAAMLVPGTDIAPVAPSIVVGDTDAAPAKAQKLAAMLDVLAQRGGGGYAVAEGLDLSATALACTASAGQALIRGVVTAASTLTLAGGLSDNAFNWVFLLQTGQLAKTSSASATPVPAAPATDCAFLGRIQVTSGTPGTPDYSGRLGILGGMLYRKTADVGPPTDSPPATLRFFNETLDGLYWWSGTAYWNVSSPGVRDHYLAAETGYLPTRTQQRLVGPFIVEAGARMVIVGRLIVE